MILHRHQVGMGILYAVQFLEAEIVLASGYCFHNGNELSI